MNSTNPEFTLLIPAEHPCYAGHFPGDPLVPGALLAQWVAETLFGAASLCTRHALR